MKYLSFLFLMCSYSLSIFSARFSLEGMILNMQVDSHVTISYASLNRGLYTEVILDSILVSHGIFRVDGDIPELTSATIEIKGKRYRFYIEPSNIKLTIDAQKPYIHLTGTSIDNEYKEVQTFFQQNDSILYAKYDYYRSHPYEFKGKEDTFTSYLQLCFKREQLLLDFCKNHPHYRIIPDLLCQALEIEMRKELTDIDKIENAYFKSPKIVRTSLLGRLLNTKIYQYNKLEKCISKPIGSEAPDFLRITTKGDTIQLSSYRDRKNVLLFFFSSWFDLKDLNNIVYNTIKDIKDYNDFAIIGIDQYIDSPWRKHYDHQNVTFPVIRDKWSNDLFQILEWDIGSLFPKEELPYYLLIDKKGIIMSLETVRNSDHGSSIDHLREQ